MATKSETELAKSPVFDAKLFSEALALFQRIPAPAYCTRAQELLSQPDPQEKMNVTGGIRQLSTSTFVFAAEPEGILASTLYYFVSLCEGVVMPQLQELIELAVAEGHKGPMVNGKYRELERARENFGPAMSFLATHADGTLLPAAPNLTAQLKSLHADRASNFRNAIAHYSFKLEIETTDVNSDPLFQAAARVAGEGFIAQAFERTCKLLRLTPSVKLPRVADPSLSRIRYEEQLGKQLSSTSRVRTFKETRELISAVERLGYSMLFAHVERGAELAAKGEIKSYVCPCGYGAIVVLATEKTATCPACQSAAPV